MEEIQIVGGNGPILHQRFKVYDFLPKTGAVENNRNLLGELSGLDERENLEELVHGSKPAREDHQRLRQIRKPELAHEKVVELEVEFIGDIRVRELLERKSDVQPDGFAFR